MSATTAPPPRHDHDWYVDALGPEMGGWLHAINELDLAAPVPSCPGWYGNDLVTHTAWVHLWATHLVETRAQEYVSRKAMDVTVPEAHEELIGWAAAAGHHLVDALASTPGDEPVWNWSSDHHARFWSRRQLQETAMHRADAELVLGRHPVIPTEVALDGIDELLAMFLGIPTLGERLNADGHGGDTLHLHATDAADGTDEWTIEVTESGFAWGHDHRKGDAAVRGSASDLLLALSNRIALDAAGLEVLGDAAVVEHWRTNTTL